MSSFQYFTVREAARLIPHGAFLARIDLKATYRKVPVYTSTITSWVSPDVLQQHNPFGLTFVPIIFNATVAWAMLCMGIPGLIHYLDDFLFWAPNYLTRCLTLEMVAHLSARLGLPIELSKVEGPTTILTFLSIKIDTVSRELWLQLARLKDTVENWATRHSMTKPQLEVLMNDAAPNSTSQPSLPEEPA